MRRNQGFTLIELMVVMAIIAILATAGLSSYGGYLKKARDSTRISDIRAINSIVQASLSSNGNATNWTTLRPAILNFNNNQIISSPLNGQDVCIDDEEAPATCQYFYSSCIDGGYIIGTRFESLSNISRYAAGQDELQSSVVVNRVDYYEIGTCTDTTMPVAWDVIE